MSNQIFISVIVPVFNEVKNIDKVISSVRAYFSLNSHFQYEIIFIDDGSRDETYSKLTPYSNVKDIRIFKNLQNFGKGYSIQKGVLNAQGTSILFLDADLSTEISELDKFMPYIQEKCPVIIGTRRDLGSNIVQKQPLLRSVFGMTYIFLVKLILNLSVSDINCGFKCIEKNVALELFKNLRSLRWGFDAEILYKASKKRYRIQEVAITWKDNVHSKVSIIKDSLRSLLELFRIRLW